MEKLRRGRRISRKNAIRRTKLDVIDRYNTSIIFHPLDVALYHDMLAHSRERCLGEARMSGGVIELNTNTLMNDCCESKCGFGLE